MAPTKIPPYGAFLATAFSAGAATTAMGLWANLPVVIAPGVGLNNFFAVTCDASRPGALTWQQGLTAVFMSGIFYILLTLAGFRTALFDAFPPHLRKAMSAGIGFFIVNVAMKISQLTEIDVDKVNHPGITSFSYVSCIIII
jgi:AGZA family xanthine/uracil permease-like MFS transporter